MGKTTEQRWEHYAARHGVPKPIRGTRDWNDERAAFFAGADL